MTLLQVLELLLGTAERIVPIFVHNPKSQQIEGVIVGTVNGVVAGLQTPEPAAAPVPVDPAAPPAVKPDQSTTAILD